MESSSTPTRFEAVPEGEALVLAWPTPNRFLRSRPDRFFAATRANADYGRPGWTRDCGTRFHRGCDVAPVHVTKTGRTAMVLFSNCETGEEYESEEPTFDPHDEVYAVCAGRINEACVDASQSDFGRHVVVEHRWPGRGRVFFTLYGHLADVRIRPDQPVETGEVLGVMGTTSRIPDARNWLAIAPHLHFEVWDDRRRAMDPVEFLTRYLPQEDDELEQKATKNGP